MPSVMNPGVQWNAAVILIEGGRIESRLDRLPVSVGRRDNAAVGPKAPACQGISGYLQVALKGNTRRRR